MDRARPGNPPGPDLLELSVTAEPEDAALIQPAFLASIRRRGLDPYAFQQIRTRHVLQYLAALALGEDRPDVGISRRAGDLPGRQCHRGPISHRGSRAR
jgi:hypothetical protein